jgi:hypothetical protein
LMRKKKMKKKLLLVEKVAKQRFLSSPHPIPNSPEL